MTRERWREPATAAPLWQRLRWAPLIDDETRAADRFAELCARLDEPGHALMREPMVRMLLGAIADHSPYLWRLVSGDPQRLVRLLQAPAGATLPAAIEAMTKACDAAATEAEAMLHLRLAKQEVALVLALADLGGAWDVVEVTQALSFAADAFVSAALSHVLRQAHATGRLKLPDPARPELGCGLVVLALGKHGGRELNYSSDTDLVAVFDPDSPAIPSGAAATTLFVNITKGIVRLLQTRTGDGYVLRVDLRLRPDPGATAIAIALPAAFSYYEVFGQNWERAAMIKARPIAGDRPVGETFLKGLVPFIWRKYFDYASIADIHAMKRQIHAVRGHADIAVAGHDVKLGRGGIREIEFFVQTQQLIFGGRRPHLRGSQTLPMLAQLRRDGWVTSDALVDLSSSYIYLRRIEHRLQMIADEQTQRLPVDPHTLERFARFCGCADTARFAGIFARHLRRVARHYALLFENEPGLDAAAGNLVFTGIENDPETLETLSRLGFKEPERAAETIRGWHFGRRPAVRTPRAREILTELVPVLVDAFAESGDPDAALAAFDSALAHMPAAVELFAILRSNAELRGLFAGILGGAPRLARMVTQRPHLLDWAITPAALNVPFSAEATAERVNAVVGAATEEFLDAIRDFGNEEMFAIGVRLMSGMITPIQAGEAYSALAGAILQATLRHVEAEFAVTNGRVAGGRCILLALGKLGSAEMTANSDLDIILIYDFDQEKPESDGPRPLHAVQYYARVAQRLVSALTVATRRGRLYEVDMRLRPSGGQGPLASYIESFKAYQLTEAETWEHMALTRARVIAGDAALTTAVEAALHVILAKPRDDKKLRHDIVEMRKLVAKVKGDKNPWDLKLVSGGILDIEFLAQYVSLGPLHTHMDIPTTPGCLARAAQVGRLTPAEAETLITAHRLFTNVAQIQRLTLDDGVEPPKANEAVKRRIALAGDVPDLVRLEQELESARHQVRKIFRHHLA